MGDPVDRDPVGPVGDRDQGGLARRQLQVASDHRAAGYGHHHVGTPPLAGPGERMAVVFTMPPPGEYPFICTYPGHARFMQGTLVSTP